MGSRGKERIVIALLVALAIAASVHYTIGRVFVFEATQPTGMSERDYPPISEERQSKQTPAELPQITSPVAVPQGETFQEAAKKFAWSELESSSLSDVERARAFSKFIFDVSHFVVKEPLVAIESKCMQPPSLPDPHTIDCSQYGSAFSGKRERRGKIAHMIQLGFDVDVLEIHLRELYDVVDVFFILESTKAHKKLVEKPLIWERIKDQERFEIFTDKVVHIILDDIDASSGNDGRADTDIWYLENVQEGIRFQKFLEWNGKQANPFSDDDMIGFGDTDEVAWRDNLYLLQHCMPAGNAIDIGIWFPMGRLDHAFRTDWPVPGHPYTLGDPTFFTLRGARERMNSGKPPSRNRGTTGRFLLGGMHMTRHRYLPFLLLEALSCSECSQWDPETVQNYKRLLTTGSIKDAEKYFDKLHSDPFAPRVVPIAQIGQEAASIQKIPWFLSCNRYRYPYWWGEHDTRLGT